MNQQPNSQSSMPGGIYPDPGQSSTSSQPTQPSTQETPRKSNIGKTVAIIIVVFILFIAAGVTLYFLTFKKSTDFALDNASNRVSNAKVKANVMNLKMSIEKYFSQHNTYVGWTPDAQILSSAKSDGAPITIQSLTEKTYVIYASFSSGKIFCTDASNPENEVNVVQPNSQTCK